MIPREALFADNEVRGPIAIEQIWLLNRRDSSFPLSSTLGSDDANLFEGAGSDIGAPIHIEYLNGAFLLPEAPNRAEQHTAHRRMLASGRVRLVNNGGDPAEVAARLVERLGRSMM
jgi:hypothetical protein